MHINYLAVLVCGIVNFILGGLWYSVLFGKAWMKAAGMNPNKKPDMSGVGIMYTGAAAGGLVMALSLAYVFELANVSDVVRGLRVSWAVWIGFVLATTLGDYLFLRRGKTLYLINNGLHFATFTVSAIILSVWR